MPIVLDELRFAREAIAYYQDQRAACYEAIEQLREEGASKEEITTMQLSHDYYHKRVMSSIDYYKDKFN